MYWSPKSGKPMARPSAWTQYVLSCLWLNVPLTENAQKLKENAKGLKLHPNEFESVLVELGFSVAEHLGKTGEGGKRSLLMVGRCSKGSWRSTGFRRAIDMYRK